MTHKYSTREEWLEAAVEQMTPLFKGKGYSVPSIRVSVGWPSSRGLSTKKKSIGECWDKSVAADKKAQIFISPLLEDPKDAQGVLATLVHEVVHAVVGLKEKHGKVFRKCAIAVGLDGKMTATVAGEVLSKEFDAWVKKIGPFPHSKLNPSEMRKQKPAQGTRMIKCECKKCGYVVRTTRKWLDDVGAPVCPCNMQPMSFELPEGGDDGDGDGEDSDE